jgi:hypothetical protein
METKTKRDRTIHRRKRTDGQIEIDKVFIAELYSKGRNHREITDALNAARPYSLSRAIISGQIKEILEDWRLYTITEIGQQRAEELLRLNKIERAAWEAWNRSKDEATKTISEKGEGRNGPSLERVIKEGRDGDPRFLTIILNCVTERCKLLGLYPAARTELTGAGGGPVLVPTVTPPVVNVVIEQTPDYKEKMALATENDTRGDGQGSSAACVELGRALLPRRF